MAGLHPDDWSRVRQGGLCQFNLLCKPGLSTVIVSVSFLSQPPQSRQGGVLQTAAVLGVNSGERWVLGDLDTSPFST
jgi:hypothetical protein